MSVSFDQNLAVKEFETCSKYKALEIKIQKMWKLHSTTVLVIVGALGLIKKGTQVHLDIPGGPLLQKIQKIALTSTARILRKFLSM